MPLKQKHRIEVGNVYRIPLGGKDGLTVAQEDELRSKYFIVIGIDSEGTIYSGLLKAVNLQKMSLLQYQCTSIRKS